MVDWRLVRRGFLALVKGAGAILIAPFVLPLAWLIAKANRKAAGLPASIPTHEEMRVLERRMADGNRASTKLWFRGAFYRELFETGRMTAPQAEEAAVLLGDCAGEPDGFGVTVRYTNGR